MKTNKILITGGAGHDKRYAIDANKILKKLGWRSKETFESHIRKTVEWFINNPEGPRRVQDCIYQRERPRLY